MRIYHNYRATSGYACVSEEMCGGIFIDEERLLLLSVFRIMPDIKFYEEPPHELGRVRSGWICQC